MAHVNPVINATANVGISNQEDIGPKTNSKSVRMLHPDMHQTSPDRGRDELAAHAKLKSVWLPDKKLNNIELKNNQALRNPLEGENGQYVKERYAKTVNDEATEVPAENQLLDVVETNETDAVI